MDLINRILNPAFDLLFRPFAGKEPLWGLTGLALLTAVLALLVYRFFSAQDRIRRVKELLKAHILEMRLFQEDPFLLGRAIGAVLRANFSYLRLNLKPFLFMFVPVVLILIQMDARFGYRPLAPGEPVLVRSYWQADSSLAEGGAEQQLEGQGIALDSPALRIPEKREIDWRVRATGAGDPALSLWTGQERVTIPLQVSGGLAPVSTWNGRRNSPELLLHPAACPLPTSGNLISVEVEYPGRLVSVAGHPVHWLWPYLVLTLVAGYLLKGLFRVQL